MTNKELLSTISTEELVAELQRRKTIKHEEREKEYNKNPRCMMCTHFASVDAYGNTHNQPPKPWEACYCPFARRKRKQRRLLCLTGSELACKNFQNKIEE